MPISFFFLSSISSRSPNFFSFQHYFIPPPFSSVCNILLYVSYMWGKLDEFLSSLCTSEFFPPAYFITIPQLIMLIFISSMLCPIYSSFLHNCLSLFLIFSFSVCSLYLYSICIFRCLSKKKNYDFVDVFVIIFFTVYK